MNILYDPQIFFLQRYGGISRYFVELMRRFNCDDGVSYSLPLKRTRNEYLLAHKELWSRTLGHASGLKRIRDNTLLPDRWQRSLPVRAYRFLLRDVNVGRKKDYAGRNGRVATREIERANYDIFHASYYNPYFLKYIGSHPFVLTVYDLIHEKLFRRLNKDPNPVEAWKALLIPAATQIIAISQNTKEDIISMFNVDDRRVHVIHLATSLPIEREYSDQEFAAGLPERYILFIGDRHTYKNFVFFLHSVAAILRQSNDLCLLCAGGPSFTAEEHFLIRRFFLERRVFHYSFVDDAQLTLVYSRALCFIFPSLYEGFGIPILEAFACGCPVALSNRACFPEIAGNAALYFDPEDEDSIAQVVSTIVANDSLREDLSAKGFERLKQFSWDATARKTRLVYSLALSTEV